MGYEFLGERITIPSALVPGINNDQSLNCQTSVGGIYSDNFFKFIVTISFTFYKISIFFYANEACI